MIPNPSVSRGSIMVPCNTCENCLKRRVSNWSFRLLQEDKQSLSSYFFTLTYAPDTTHITRNGFMGLRKEDLQGFIKRTRARSVRGGQYGNRFKYFAVGEYGGKYMRPHYHVIAFNWDLSVLVGSKNYMAIERGLIKLDGKHEFHNDAWPHGHFTVGSVGGASVGYTMKYISKPSRVPAHRNDDRLPEFALMSKGLGESYLTEQMAKYHLADLERRQFVNGKDGEKYAMPRYYKKKLLSIQDKECLKAWNILEAMKEQKPKENTARERSEAIYAGIERSKLNYLKGQKF